MQVLIRGRGPSLGDAGVPGVLPDPMLTLFSGADAIASNDNWMDAANSGDVPVPLAPPYPGEAAILTTLAPGAYTAILQGVAGTEGVGIVEVFRVHNGEPSASRLTNLSTRGMVRTGDDVIIGGIILEGSGTRRIVVTARGPSLAAAGVPGTLADPEISLFNSAGALVASNSSWREGEGAESLPPWLPLADDSEAAIVRSLAPGAYTAIVTGAGGSQGIGIVEVFDLE